MAVFVFNLNPSSNPNPNPRPRSTVCKQANPWSKEINFLVKLNMVLKELTLGLRTLNL